MPRNIALAHVADLDTPECPRCHGYHETGMACPIMRGVSYSARRLPDLGWRGSVTIPTALGSVQVSAEIPPGFLAALAGAPTSSLALPEGPGAHGLPILPKRGNVSGTEAGFLPLIMAALQSPQGQQALQSMMGGASTAMDTAQQLHKAIHPGAANLLGSILPMMGGMMGGMGMGGMGGGGQQAQGVDGDDDEMDDDEDYGEDADEERAEHRRRPPPRQVKSYRALPQPFPALNQVLRMLPRFPLFAAHGLTVGEPYPPLPNEAYQAMSPDSRAALAESRMAEPFAVLAHAPALLGSQALLHQAAHAAACHPELCASVCELMCTALAVCDAEAGRLLGDPEATRVIAQARASSVPKIVRALALAQQLLASTA